MKKILCLFFTLILLGSVFTSCGRAPAAEGGEGSGTQEESLTETKTPADPLSNYTIVYPASADKHVKACATRLQSALMEASGGAIRVREDGSGGGEGGEILLGKTDRPESREVYEELGEDYGYILRQVGDKLVVAAPTAELLNMATERLTAKYMKPTADGSYPLSKTVSYEEDGLPYMEPVTKGTLNYQIVYPASASKYFMTAINELSAALRSVAATAPALIPDSDPSAKTKNAIVLGPVNLSGIPQMAKNLPPLCYQVMDSGNQVFYVGQDDATMIDVCHRLMDKIACGRYEDGTVRLSLPIGETVYAHDWMEPIPEIPSDTGTFHSLEECSTDVFRFYYRKSTLEKFEGYTDSLEDAGFVLYAENRIGEHLYRTYRKNRCMVHAYYTHTTKDFRVLVGEMKPYDLTPVSDGAVTDPALVLMAADYSAQPGNGLGMVFTMKDGSFVLVDGGWGADTQGLYEYLVANNKRSDGILIRAWIITHPHEDHYGNLLKFSELYADQVKVERFVANFAEGAYAVDGSANDDVARILPAMETFEGAELLIPQVGQKMYFGELSVEFLYTVECAYPANSSIVVDSNNHSLCAKMDFYGKSILMTGDSYGFTCNYLVETYDTYLQADYLQVPHHNGNGGSAAFYSRVKPKVILVSTSKERYDWTLTQTGEPLYYLLKSMNTVEKVYVADNGYQTVE